MKRAVDYPAYPLAPAPHVRRWLFAGLALLGTTVGGGALMHPLVERRDILLAGVWVTLGWVLSLLAKLLRFRLNRHNAGTYAAAVEQERLAWWHQHRKTVGMLDCVLVSPACTRAEQLAGLLSGDAAASAQPSDVAADAIRLSHILDSDPAARECALACMLAMHWQAQQSQAEGMRPLACYWQGSLLAWQAFRNQLLQSAPDTLLPEQPEQWRGLDTLDTLIDRLQGAPADARVLYAGSHCEPHAPGAAVAAGEAAVLWLLGPDGPVRLFRGEWYCPETDTLTAVAERAMSQLELTAPVPACMAFAQHRSPELTALGWSTPGCALERHFGALGDLQAMLVQTLAAWYAGQYGVACGWLAADPRYALTLGIVEPADAKE